MFYIRKSSGDKQRFDLHKFRRSLFKAGASEKVANSIIQHIEKEKPSSTKRIHAIATKLLQEQSPSVADRYNLKRALMELGPEGYPFEQFVAELFRLQGYDAKTNRVLSGACIDHEVDIILKEKDHRYIVECKFHNRIGMKSDVKVAMYVQARFQDIKEAWKKNTISDQNKQKIDTFHQAWIVTNTQLTSEAIKYGECRNMRLLAWGYPMQDSLADLIQKYNLFPITTLTSLTKYQKKTFLKKGLVLCKDARKYKKTFQKLGLKAKNIENIIKEAEAVCKI